jgi:hypothetical protein
MILTLFLAFYFGKNNLGDLIMHSTESGKTAGRQDGLVPNPKAGFLWQTPEAATHRDGTTKQPSDKENSEKLCSFVVKSKSRQPPVAALSLVAAQFGQKIIPKG